MFQTRPFPLALFHACSKVSDSTKHLAHSSFSTLVLQEGPYSSRLNAELQPSSFFRFVKLVPIHQVYLTLSIEASPDAPIRANLSISLPTELFLPCFCRIFHIRSFSNAPSKLTYNFERVHQITIFVICPRKLPKTN